MSTNTTRLGVLKPAGPEYVDVIDQINAAYDKFDFALGATWIDDGYAPPSVDQYDGKIWRERTSGQVFVSRLVSGVFTLRKINGTNDADNANWAHYTFAANAVASGVATALGNTSVTRDGGTLLDTTDIAVVSAKNIQLIKGGLYLFTISATSSVSSGSFRRYVHYDITPDTVWGDVRGSGFDDENKFSVTGQVKVDAGTPQTIVPTVYQISGAPSNFSGVMRIIRVDKA